ncbi:MAG: energy-coupling factor transporter transmembrane protein EcfT [Treponema sp.]|nr:energy-coupling factor transporter transmembrane protein EcfT [Treponema sp.]MCL2250661.1 energy-coupling factor transporter transmembrane protein EcfT [Treponema sp.]
MLRYRQHKLKSGSLPSANRICALTKLLCVLLITVLIFLVNKLMPALCLLIILLVVRFFTHIRIVIRLPVIINLSLLAVFIILMQTIFAPGSTYIVKPLFPSSFPVFGGMGSLKWEGFFLALIILCRLFALILLLPLFTKTTSQGEIASSLCSLGINYKAAFTITAAFNLIPVFKEEASLIIDAQKLRRSVSFDKRSFFSGIKAYTGLLLPLILGAMRKAESSSVSMDSRAFGIYKTRTWIDKPKMKAVDFLFISACIVFFASLLIINYKLPFIF